MRDGASRAGAGPRPRAGGHRRGRGGRHRAGGWPDHPLGHAGDAGGGAHRGERAGRQGRGRAADRRRRPRRPDQHAVPEHLGDPGDRRDGRHGHRHGDRDGPDRDDADIGVAGPVAPAEGARLADEGAGHHRLERGGLHRRRRPDPRPRLRRPGAARHGDGDLGHPDRHAGVRVRPALARRQAARRGPRGRQEPHRRGDARSDERDQHRQDRHPDDERDDGLDPLRGRVVVQRHGAGLREDGHDRVRRRCAGARLHPPRARAGARHRRHGRRRRHRDRRPDRGRPRRPRGEAGRRRRGDAPRLPATRGGPVRLRLQVHGDVPSGHCRRSGARHRARQGRSGRRLRALHPRRRPAQRLAGSDRGGAGRPRRGQRAHGREGPARARVRCPPRGRRRAGRDGRGPDVAYRRTWPSWGWRG